MGEDFPSTPPYCYCQNFFVASQKKISLQKRRSNPIEEKTNKHPILTEREVSVVERFYEEEKIIHAKTIFLTGSSDKN